MSDKHLFQEELGRRISSLRKLKGYSQADLARQLNISRSSLAQIELGNRSIDALELQGLSLALGFSLDEFMSAGFMVNDLPLSYAQQTKEVAVERDPAPKLKAGKLRNVLLYILGKCAGKPNVGEKVLSKLLYFSEFNYFELYEEHLIGASYRKLPYGPVPGGLTTMISDMIGAGLLKRIITEYHGLPQTRYLPLVKAELSELRASEKEVIDKVIEQMSDWSAAAITNYAHKDMPWLATREGGEINYELAFYRDIPYSVRSYDEQTEEHEV